VLHVIAEIDLHPGTRERFLAEFRRIVPLVRAEAGCLAYGPAVDADSDLPNQHRDPDRVTIIEQWEDLARLKAHLAAPHMVEYRPKVKEYMRQSTLRILEPA
jgi:quinol monooxygenase YgiN